MIPIDNVDEVKTTTDEDSGLKRSFQFDFESMRFVIKDGKVNEVEKKNAVLQWCKTFLYTILNKFEIYEGYEFGISLNDFIGLKKSNLGLIKSELERQVTENITINPAIKGIDNFNCSTVDDKLLITFTVILDSEKLEVDAYV